MTGQDETFADQLLYCQECIAEIFGVLDSGNIATNQAPALIEGAAA